MDEEKKLNKLSQKLKLLSTKGYIFLLGRMYFISNGGYQSFLIFAPMLNSITLDKNKKILTRY